MRTTINGQQILLLLAKYGPKEFDHLSQYYGKKVNLTLKSTEDSQFHAVFETAEEKTDDER